MHLAASQRFQMVHGKLRLQKSGIPPVLVFEAPDLVSVQNLEKISLGFCLFRRIDIPHGFRIQIGFHKGGLLKIPGSKDPERSKKGQDPF